MMKRRVSAATLIVAMMVSASLSSATVKPPPSSPYLIFRVHPKAADKTLPSAQSRRSRSLSKSKASSFSSSSVLSMPKSSKIGKQAKDSLSMPPSKTGKMQAKSSKSSKTSKCAKSLSRVSYSKSSKVEGSKGGKSGKPGQLGKSGSRDDGTNDRKKGDDNMSISNKTGKSGKSGNSTRDNDEEPPSSDISTKTSKCVVEPPAVPIINDDHISVVLSTANGTRIDVLQNDIVDPPDKKQLIVNTVITSNPARGTCVIAEDKKAVIYYLPSSDSSFARSVKCRYEACIAVDEDDDDGQEKESACDWANVSIFMKRATSTGMPTGSPATRVPTRVPAISPVVARDDSISVPSATNSSIDVLDNDYLTDSPGKQLIVNNATTNDPSNGTCVIANDKKTLVYIPPSHWLATGEVKAKCQYKACVDDNQRLPECAWASATISAYATASPVIAMDDSISDVSETNETRIDVLQNDFTNPPGQQLVVKDITMDPTFGTCALAGDKKAVIYTPPSDPVLDEQIEFEYEACIDDGLELTCDRATMIIIFAFTSAPTASPVVARDDNISILSTANENLLEVLQNDFTNLPGQQLVVKDVTMEPSSGTWALASDKKAVIYTQPSRPLLDEQIEFEYEACIDDGLELTCDRAHVIISFASTRVPTVSPVTRVPTASPVIARDDSISVPATTNSSIDVLDNDYLTVAPRRPLFVNAVVTDDPTNGTCVVADDKNAVVYLPPSNWLFTGEVNVKCEYEACVDDDERRSECAWASVIISVNVSPVVAIDDSISVVYIANGTRIDVLQNDFTNPSGQQLIVKNITVEPSSGTGAISDDKKGVIYTLPPDPLFVGQVEFEYEACIDYGYGLTCDRANVTISFASTSAPSASPVVAVDDSIFVVLSTTNGTRIYVLQNDSTNPPGQQLIVKDITMEPSAGTCDLADDKKAVIYTPPSGLLIDEQIEFEYEACIDDGLELKCGRANVTIIFDPAEIEPTTSPSTQPSTRAPLAPSISVSPSSVHTGSPSISSKPSLRHSMIPSVSTYPSWAHTNLPSVSTKPSLRPSLSPSISMVPSLTHTDWPSISTKPSIVNSSSPSISMSPSLVHTDLPSISTKPSIRSSSSPSISVSPSLTPSDLPSTSHRPSLQPSANPSYSTAPSLEPSLSPTDSAMPTGNPASSPSGQPSVIPTNTPSISTKPSLHPSLRPSISMSPSLASSDLPSISSRPSLRPSGNPSYSTSPSLEPSLSPTDSAAPTSNPASSPSGQPSIIPTNTGGPTLAHSEGPSVSAEPSSMPSENPSISIWPSNQPTDSTMPSSNPDSSPSGQPSMIPTSTGAPTLMHSEWPSISGKPSFIPSENPSISASPSNTPSMSPTATGAPSLKPSDPPSVSTSPSSKPTSYPSVSAAPSRQPSMAPSASTSPTSQPSGLPSVSDQPSSPPSSSTPTITPTSNPTTPPPIQRMVCVSDHHFRDKRNRSCKHYVRPNVSYGCEGQDTTGWVNDAGVSPWDACCFCGGGTMRFPPTPTPEVRRTNQVMSNDDSPASTWTEGGLGSLN